MSSRSWLPFEMLPSEMCFSGLYFFLLIILSMGAFFALTPWNGGGRMHWRGTRGRFVFALWIWALRPREQLPPGEGRIIPFSARRVARVAVAW